MPGITPKSADRADSKTAATLAAVKAKTDMVPILFAISAAVVLAGCASISANAAEATTEATNGVAEAAAPQDTQSEAVADAQPVDMATPAAEEPASEADIKAEPEKQKTKTVCKYVKTSTSRLGRKVCTPVAKG